MEARGRRHDRGRHLHRHRPRPPGPARISRATGLSVVMGAGYYVPVSHPEGMDDMSEDDIAEEIVRDVTEGVGETGVRAGIIGEIGCVFPLSANVLKVVRAAARAQVRTGAPILIHPGTDRLRRPRSSMSWWRPGPIPPTSCSAISTPHHGPRGPSGAGERGHVPGVRHVRHRARRLRRRPEGHTHAQRCRPDGLLEYLVGLGHREQVVIAHDVCHRWRFVRSAGRLRSHIRQRGAEVACPRLWRRRYRRHARREPRSGP